uniref:Chromosome 8 open reading frame 82 n=1 Tax=Podarcis muralis TaxID=64176 RepID=A0A670I6Z3_PODMU|nr:UPF0598 protein C8orf82 homolog isoform X1 [Podarcis muralis]
MGQIAEQGRDPPAERAAWRGEAVATREGLDSAPSRCSERNVSTRLRSVGEAGPSPDRSPIALPVRLGLGRGPGPLVVVVWYRNRDAAAAGRASFSAEAGDPPRTRPAGLPAGPEPHAPHPGVLLLYRPPGTDKQFLVFFFKQLKLNQSGRYEAAFPYLSPCGREQNFVRCDDRPIVFTHLLQGASGEELLSYCGGADKLAVPFQPEKLLMLPENGRVYHPGPEKAGGVGLVKSALAFELSSCFDYEQGPGQAPTHFRWRDRRHALTNELLPFIRKDEGT